VALSVPVGALRGSARPPVERLLVACAPTGCEAASQPMPVLTTMGLVTGHHRVSWPLRRFRHPVGVTTSIALVPDRRQGHKSSSEEGRVPVSLVLRPLAAHDNRPLRPAHVRANAGGKEGRMS